MGGEKWAKWGKRKKVERRKNDLKKWMNRCAKCGGTKPNGNIPAKSSYPIGRNGNDTCAINGYYWLMQPRPQVESRWMGPAQRRLAYEDGPVAREDYIT
ncbi:uncharacterized protein N7518_004073 [Penicillium psychrosexuale]|uniref:uncharacterized protein n=1 Tax=Penicillium psychrosexuale TaxID=1002107 RepID=UPI002544E636|nr:uncharacterized protein N7518_004073 [Penicillium psychrosexuale]KAJ5795533.1 hypothetical protein N7518_004073 [Penicillium psychrosexuale]